MEALPRSLSTLGPCAIPPWGLDGTDTALGAVESWASPARIVLLMVARGQEGLCPRAPQHRQGAAPASTSGSLCGPGKSPPLGLC